jgi:hypothetical protein
MSQQISVSVSLRIDSANPSDPLTILGEETATKGDWNLLTGAEGVTIFNSENGIPVTSAGNLSHTWLANSTDNRCLKKRTTAGYIAACIYNTSPFTISIPQTSHDIYLYFLDWDRVGRVQLLEFFDGATKVGEYTISDFGEGKYLKLRSSVALTVRISKIAGINGVISGVFFGGPYGEIVPEPVSPDWDADYVSQIVPTTLETDQVFSASITFRNTGEKQWGMLSGQQYPPTLMATGDAWGTDFIILGQGRFIDKGVEAAFPSSLRAPSIPGAYRFKWRLSHHEVGLYGDESPETIITVVPSTVPAPTPLPTPTPDDEGRRPLMPEDLQYIGSIRLPRGVGVGGAGYSETGLCLGEPGRLLVNYNHPGQSLFEINIPEPVPYNGTNIGAIPVATVTKQWGGVHGDGIGPMGSIFYKDGKLHWSWYHGYWTGGSIPCFGMTQLNPDGTWQHIKTWMVPNQKWYWGGAILLPESFANKYLQGRRTGLGFGAYYSIVASASRGAALGVFNEPDVTKTSLEIYRNLLGYPPPEAAVRKGDCFFTGINYWNDQPTSMERGKWGAEDYCRAGVMIHLPDVAGFIAFPRMGLGRIGYDYGSHTSAGTVTDWYFYQPHEMATVGGPLIPYAITRSLNPPGVNYTSMVTSAFIDEATRRVYVLRNKAYQVGTELDPLIDVYHVREL